jgi:broad specificity phosphatase PhoE
VWNAERRFQGQSDIPLDETGLAQADRAARLLAALRPDMIVSSDLSRASATAAPLARLTGLEVILDKDLRERAGGRWEGLNDAEIRAQYPEAHRTWDPPDGEVSATVADRVAAAMQRVVAAVAERVDRADGLAVVVSHGAAIRLGMARLLRLPDELSGLLGPLGNCAWSVLGSWHGEWRLLEHNAGTLPEPVLSDDR